MSNSIPRKPVASATSVPPIAPAPAYISSASDSDLSKDLEKDDFGEKTRRVSTEIDEPLPPYRAPTYKRILTGFGGGFAFGKGASAQNATGQKRYFGLTKRMFVICCVAIVLVILALAIGLGVGLSGGKKYVNNGTFPNSSLTSSLQNPKPTSPVQQGGPYRRPHLFRPCARRMRHRQHGCRQHCRSQPPRL